VALKYHQMPQKRHGIQASIVNIKKAHLIKAQNIAQRRQGMPYVIPSFGSTLT
jgi:hypothetical protein